MPIPLTTRPLNRSFMREEVYNTLLDWIMEGELRPGEKLLDKELAERMGISRTPVREALRRLEDKGLVESAANRWTRVSAVSIDEPEKIYQVIWTLEELAVNQVIEQMSAADFARMSQANERLRDAVAAHHPVQASAADIEFHGVFIQKSRNSYLISILHDLKISYRRVEVTYFEKGNCGKHSYDEHRRILEAMQAGDRDMARAMVRLNWQNSLQRLRQLASTKK